MKNQQLWDKLSSFLVDDNSAPRSFLKKLAEENKWSPELAAQAFEEYKKFMYLATMMEVTPSKRIDEVWHLHLQYTKSYWKDMCSILGREIHHNPGDGNEVAEAKFRDVYKETLDAYETEFGYPAPSSVWGRGEEIVRVKSNIDNLKKRSRLASGVRAVLGMSAVLLMASGTAVMIVLGVILGGIILALIINSAIKSSNRKNYKSYGNSGRGTSSSYRSSSSYSSCSSSKKKKKDDDNSSCVSTPISSCSSSSCSSHSSCSSSSCSSSSGGGDSGGGGSSSCGSSSCGSSCGGGGCGGGD